MHLFSLVKRRDVDRVSDDSDPGCARLGEPTCECPPGAGLPASAAREPAGVAS
jgi:hypothetical protein